MYTYTYTLMDPIYAQRLMGFAGCAGLGWVLSMMVKQLDNFVKRFSFIEVSR